MISHARIVASTSGVSKSHNKDTPLFAKDTGCSLVKRTMSNS